MDVSTSENCPLAATFIPAGSLESTESLLVGPMASSSDADTLRLPSPSSHSLPEAEAERLELSVGCDAKNGTNNCAICLDDVHLKTVIQPCFHHFCHLCIFEWFKQKTICPVCRQSITKILYNIKSNIEYNEFLFLSLGKSSPEQRFALISSNDTEESRLSEILEGSSGRSSRNVQAMLVQILAHIRNKFPDLNFPPRKLDFKTFSSSIEFPEDHSDIPDLFRCFIYINNYKPLGNFAMSREIHLDFLQNNPSLIHRLLNFIKLEINSLRKAFNFNVSFDVFDQINNALKTLDIKSSEFKTEFRSILSRNGSLFVIFSQIIDSHDILDKLYREFVLFAQSPFSEHGDFSSNVQYVWNAISNSNEEKNSLASDTGSMHIPVTSAQKPIEVITIFSDSSQSSEVEWIPPVENCIFAADYGVSKGKRNQQLNRAGPSQQVKNHKYRSHLSKLAPILNEKNGLKPNCIRASRSRQSGKNFQHSRKDIMEMRRILRNAEHSSYFYRKLLREIQKKIYHHETVLNSRQFSHLEDFFKDIFLNSKLHHTRKLNGDDRDSRNLDDLRSRLTDSYSGSRSSDFMRNKGDELTSTESEDLTDSALDPNHYEEDNWLAINEQLTAHAMKPNGQKASTQGCLSRPGKRKIEFINRFYTSNSES